MCSKVFIPRALTCVSLFLMMSFSLLAQSKSLGETWKTTTKSDSEKQDNFADSVSDIWKNSASSNQNKISQASPQTEVTVKNQNSTNPVEPAVKAANPPVELDDKALLVKSAKLEFPTKIMPEEELEGIAPPRTFQATAYSLRGRTRSGAYVRRGVLAADPQVLPIGSVVHLKAGNYSGVYTVHDTGGAIRGKRIDVWMPSSREARSFGRQSVRLTVLKYGGKRKAKR